MRYLSVLAFISTSLAAESGYVHRVSDGDTVTIITDSQTKVKCRLYGIDAPEKKQPYGSESRDTLAKMVLGVNVSYLVKNTDMYGRSVCIISFLEEGRGRERIANEEMLRLGMAWAYVQYLKRDKDKTNLKKYLELQGDAMQDRVGLWQDSSPQAPWEFRRKNRRRHRGK